MEFIPRLTLNEQICAKLALCCELTGLLEGSPASLEIQPKDSLIQRISTLLMQELAQADRSFDAPGSAAALSAAAASDPQVQLRLQQRSAQLRSNTTQLMAQWQALNPHKPQDMLRAHQLLLQGLHAFNGHWRQDSAHVRQLTGSGLTREPAPDIPERMHLLCAWYEHSNLPVLLKSAVFYAKFTLIAPFNRGNESLGTLWLWRQLAHWRISLSALTLHSLTDERHAELQHCLQRCSQSAEYSEFVAWLLTAIARELTELLGQTYAHSALLLPEQSAEKSSPNTQDHRSIDTFSGQRFPAAEDQLNDRQRDQQSVSVEENSNAYVKRSLAPVTDQVSVSDDDQVSSNDYTSLTEHTSYYDSLNLDVTGKVLSLLKVLGSSTLTAAELMTRLKLKHRPSFFAHYLNPALERGLIERTVPHRPHSRNQRYRLRSK
ncbi:MAG: Fic family protein [Succinivibrio sp.]|nr:Fic family protein [Succinivibrio sp.]